MRVRIATSGPDAHVARDILRARGHEVVDGVDDPVDLVVVDEWTAESDPTVLRARAAGCGVTVLAELILDDAPHPVVGVTGTAGKTSTCRALEHVLTACGVPVAISSTARSGNAWPDHSLAAQLDAPEPGTVTVAELTSTHLCHMSHVHPDVAVVTTIRPDHLELHGGIDAYVAAKRRLVAELTDDDAVVLPTDDPQAIALLGPVRGVRWGFGAEPGERGAFWQGAVVQLRSDDATRGVDTTLTGPPLRAALAASAAALALGMHPDHVGDALGGLDPVAHRQVPRPGPRGITIVDDSMAATPMKVQAALERFAANPLVVVLGGDDSLGGQPVHASPEESDLMARVLSMAHAGARAVVAFGPARARMAPFVTPSAEADGIAHALEKAIELCPDGGTVLVSPMFPLTPEQREVAAGTR
ncbi:MAG: Mur ligase family protein [Actinomycetota bacterium]